MTDKLSNPASMGIATMIRSHRLILMLLLLVAFCSGIARDPHRLCHADTVTENVILITMDGYRWEELFGGAEKRLISKQFGGVSDGNLYIQRYWRESAEERRQILTPFFWSVIAQEGQIFGDPSANCVAKVLNNQHFSYPGYNEILTGFADPQINSNDKIPNRNVTVLEWLHRKPGYDGKVAAFTSWDVFPFIINDRRSGIPVNAGWQPLSGMGDSAEEDLLNAMARELPQYWQGVRFDAFTYRGALDCLRTKKPRVLYVSLGETDDWAHARRYDLYLDAAKQNDDAIRQLWETAQAMPQYAGKTSLVITTDHGRGGNPDDWISHSTSIPGCDRIWIAVLGPDTPAEGVRRDVEVTQSQVAATVAALLGEDYHAAETKSGEVLPGVINTGSE